MISISRNLCIDHYRSVRKERETIDRDVDANELSPQSHDPGPVAAYLARAAMFPDFVASGVWLNGLPGARIDVGGEPTAVSFAIENGRITRICAIRNPDKLGWLDRVAELQR